MINTCGVWRLTLKPCRNHWVPHLTALIALEPSWHAAHLALADLWAPFLPTILSLWNSENVFWNASQQSDWWWVEAWERRVPLFELRPKRLLSCNYTFGLQVLAEPFVTLRLLFHLALEVLQVYYSKLLTARCLGTRRGSSEGWSYFSTGNILDYQGVDLVD
jgi:hypothetical protein